MFGHAAFSDAPFGDIETSIFITASLSKDLNFTKTTTGAILFVTVDAGATVESWTERTHSGDTWTDKSASATTETWTERIV